MDDVIVIAAIAVVAGLALWPAMRRWLRSGDSRPLVEPDQNITVEDVLPGVPGIYRMRFRNRILPRGRRHKAPPGAVVHQRDRDRDRGSS